MTLQEMFIDIKYRHDGRGAKDAKRGITDLKGAVDNLYGAIDRVNNALQTMSQIALGTAVAGTAAYAGWSRTMAEFAGKAGLTERAFRKLYVAESGLISRSVGGPRSIALESMQRLHSLGANTRQAHYLARLGNILHSGRQAHGPQAVSSAMELQRSGFGEAGGILQKTYQAAQSGSGNVPDYFSASIKTGSIAAEAGVGINDVLAGLAVLSGSGTLPEASTKMSALIRSLARKAPKESEDFFRERTGQDWSFLTDMLRQQGMLSVLDYLSENFKEGEAFRLFTEVEAVKAFGPLSRERKRMRDIRGQVSGASETRPIERFAREVLDKSFFNVLEKLKNSFGDLFKAIGRPWSKIVTPFLDAIAGLINLFLALNTATGGLLAWIPALFTSLLLFNKLILGLLVRRLLQPLITGVGNMVRNAPAVFGALGDRVRAAGGTARQRAAAASGGAAKWFAGGWLAAALGNIIKPFAKVFDILKTLTTRLLMFGAFIKMGAIAMAAIAAVLAPFALWSKFRSDKDFDPTSGFGGDQMRYFAEGKPDGGAPPAGWRDIKRHNRIVAGAEAELLWGALKKAVGDWFVDVGESIRNSSMAGSVLMWFVDGYINLYKLIWEGIDKAFTTIGEWIRRLWNNPVEALGALWDMFMTGQSITTSAMIKQFLPEDKMPKGAKSLEKATEMLEGDVQVVRTIQASPNSAAAFGQTGGDHSKALDGAMVLPFPQIQWDSGSTASPTTVNQTNSISVTVEGGNTNEETAQIIGDEIDRRMKRSADLLQQENLDPSIGPSFAR